MAFKRFDVDVWVGDKGMQLSSKGDELLVRARFNRETDNLERFLSDLRNAILLWCRHHPSSKESLKASKSSLGREQVHDSGYLEQIHLPKTPKEITELQTLAAEGPAAVYRWIYGPTSMMARAMEGTTWKQFGVADPAEGCQRILQSIRDHDNDLHTLRPHLRRGGSTKDGR